jgi:hypothetical protein
MLTDHDKEEIGEVVTDVIKDVLFPTLEKLATKDEIKKLATKDEMNQRFDSIDANLNRLDGKTDRLQDRLIAVESIPAIAHNLKR